MSQCNRCHVIALATSSPGFSWAKSVGPRPTGAAPSRSRALLPDLLRSHSWLHCGWVKRERQQHPAHACVRRARQPSACALQVRPSRRGLRAGRGSVDARDDGAPPDAALRIRPLARLYRQPPPQRQGRRRLHGRRGPSLHPSLFRLAPPRQGCHLTNLQPLCSSANGRRGAELCGRKGIGLQVLAHRQASCRSRLGFSVHACDAPGQDAWRGREHGVRGPDRRAAHAGALRGPRAAQV